MYCHNVIGRRAGPHWAVEAPRVEDVADKGKSTPLLSSCEVAVATIVAGVHV